MTGEHARRSTFKDVILFFYLAIGAVGTTTLVAIALELRIVDFLGDYFLILMIAVYALSQVAWIPAIALIIVYRRSWLIILPAATAIASSIGMFLETYSASRQDPGEWATYPVAPFIWLAAFFPVALVCGLVWAVKRVSKSGT